MLPTTPWRNGSASDSRSEGCVFESRRGQVFCCKKIEALNTQRLESLYLELLFISDRHLLYSIFQSSSFSGAGAKHKFGAGRFLVSTFKSISSRTKTFF